MLLAISTTHSPATDLGYLLHKHPERIQSFDLSFGKATVFYPEATQERCTAALMLDIDPVRLVRKKGAIATWEQYVNDRPYVASSFLSVAIAQIFGTALAGRCNNNPALAQTPIPISAKIAVLPCHGGESLLRRLFEPLGYEIAIESHLLDEQFPDWGNSPYLSVELRHTVTLQTLLSHLYVLIPVLDTEKHYWIDDEEVDKLLRRGEGWLANHPEQQLIARRYLKHQGKLIRSALIQLLEEESEGDRQQEQAEVELEKPISLNQQRLETVVETLKRIGAKRVVDLGCGEGKLLKKLLQETTFTEIIGVDVAHRTLERAMDNLKLDRIPDLQKQRIRLWQGSLTYRDKRLSGYDAATVIEVIEHLDMPRLKSFERVLFEFARPKTAIITTPNREYNIKFESLSAGKLRHQDHRFEWTRTEFQTWATQIAERFSYSVEFYAIGTEDPIVGAPTQMGIFSVISKQ